jgi:hypothetical protein
VTDVLARADELVQQLRDAGLSATADPAKVDAAFKQAKGTAVVLVEPLPQFTNPALCGDWLTTWRLIALAPRVGGKIPADRLIRAVDATVDVLPIAQAVPGSYALEEGQAAYPAYIMTMEE